MRIPPVPEFRILVNIFLTNVKAAHISDAVIDYHDLTVVPVIDPKMQPANQGRKELGTLNAFLFQLLPDFLTHLPAAHGIIKNAYFNALLYLFLQNLHNAPEQLIVLNNIILDMNGLLRIPHILLKGCKLILPIHKKFHVIVIAQYGARGMQMIHHKIRIICNTRIFFLQLLTSDHQLLTPDRICQTVFDLLGTEHFPLVHICPNQQVKHKSQHRNEIQDQKPGPHGFGISPLKKDHHNTQKHIDDQKMRKYKGNTIMQNLQSRCHFCCLSHSF